MKTRQALKLLIAASAASLLAGVAQADSARQMEEAMQFYERGQYLFALDRFRAAARAGDARAAEVLGMMYAVGPQLYPGIPRDAGAAGYWLDIAARGGRPVSRFVVCALRRHVPAPQRTHQCFDWVAETGQPGAR